MVIKQQLPTFVSTLKGKDKEKHLNSQSGLQMILTEIEFTVKERGEGQHKVKGLQSW